MRNIISILCILFGHSWYFKDADYKNFNFCTRCPVDRGSMRCGGLISPEEAEKLLGKDVV